MRDDGARPDVDVIDSDVPLVLVSRGRNVVRRRIWPAWHVLEGRSWVHSTPSIMAIAFPTATVDILLLIRIKSINAHNGMPGATS